MQYQSITEKTIFFDLPKSDGLCIKGILRGELAGPLAVMVHGRPGSGNELLQYLGARYLHERGISTLRLFLYDVEPRTRNLLDCTLQTHVDDFETVINNLHQHHVKQLYAVGHSYGGLTILESRADLDAAVLWDPSHGLWWAENRGDLQKNIFPEVTVGKYVIGTAGSGWVYPAAAEAYDQQLGDTSSLAAKNYPLKIISAGKGALSDLGERYIEAVRMPKSHKIIADAHHSFEDSDEVMLELFAETHAWLTRTFPPKQ